MDERLNDISRELNGKYTRLYWHFKRIYHYFIRFLIMFVVQF